MAVYIILIKKKNKKEENWREKEWKRIEFKPNVITRALLVISFLLKARSETHTFLGHLGATRSHKRSWILSFSACSVYGNVTNWMKIREERAARGKIRFRFLLFPSRSLARAHFYPFPRSGCSPLPRTFHSFKTTKKKEKKKMKEERKKEKNIYPRIQELYQL